MNSEFAWQCVFNVLCLGTLTVLIVGAIERVTEYRAMKKLDNEWLERKGADVDTDSPETP